MSYERSVDPRRRNQHTASPRPDRVGPWGVLQGLGYVVLRRILRTTNGDAADKVSRAHGHSEPHSIHEAHYGSCDVEYNGRTIRTDPMSAKQLISLVELYLKQVNDAENRIKHKFRESAQIGHELAAAMILVQCQEGNLCISGTPVEKRMPRPPSTSRPEERSREYRVSTSPARAGATKILPFQDRRASTTPYLKEDFKPMPFAKWGILEAIAYELMVHVMDYSIRQISSIIWYDPLHTQLSTHSYPSTVIGYRQDTCTTRSMFHKDVSIIVERYLKQYPDRALQIKRYFAEDKRHGHLLASAMVYTQSVQAGLICASEYSSDRGARPSRDRPRSAREGSVRSPRPTDRAFLDKVRRWDFLDAMTFETMRRLFDWSNERIAFKLKYSPEAINLVDSEEGMKTLKTLMFPSMTLPMDGRLLRTPSLRYAEVQAMIEHFRRGSSSTTIEGVKEAFNPQDRETIIRICFHIRGEVTLSSRMSPVILWNDRQGEWLSSPASREVGTNPLLSSLPGLHQKGHSDRLSLGSTTGSLPTLDQTIHPDRLSLVEFRTSPFPESNQPFNQDCVSTPEPRSMLTSHPLSETRYERIYETWNILDMISFRVLHKYQHCSAEQISVMLRTRISDIIELVQTIDRPTSFSSGTTIWPARQIQFQGHTGWTRIMRPTDLDLLLSTFFGPDPGDASQLERLHPFYMSETPDLEGAATLIYCETFPKIKHLISPLDYKRTATQVLVTNSGRGEPISPPMSHASLDSQDISTTKAQTNGSTKTTKLTETAVLNAAVKRPKNWSMLNSIQKRARQEPPPNPDALDLVPSKRGGDTANETAASGLPSIVTSLPQGSSLPISQVNAENTAVASVDSLERLDDIEDFVLSSDTDSESEDENEGRMPVLHRQDSDDYSEEQQEEAGHEPMHLESAPDPPLDPHSQLTPTTIFPAETSAQIDDSQLYIESQYSSPGSSNIATLQLLNEQPLDTPHIDEQSETMMAADIPSQPPAASNLSRTVMPASPANTSDTRSPTFLSDIFSAVTKIVQVPQFSVEKRRSLVEKYMGVKFRLPQATGTPAIYLDAILTARESLISPDDAIEGQAVKGLLSLYLNLLNHDSESNAIETTTTLSPDAAVRVVDYTVPDEDAALEYIMSLESRDDSSASRNLVERYLKVFL